MSYLINVYCTVNTLPELTFPHLLNGQRDRGNPELLEHLDGFIGYVMNQCGEKETMTHAKYYVFRHIQRTRHHISLSVEEDDFGEFVQWAWDANAICFQQSGVVTDPSGFTLTAPGENEPEEEAHIPYPVKTMERKFRTDQYLKERKINVAESLPPVVGESEAVLRTPRETAQRALSLFAVCLRAESLGLEDEIPFSEIEEKFPLSCAALTPAERAFMETKEPAQQAVVNFSWRYEALAVLQWALGMTDDLPFPDACCDVPTLAKRHVGIDETEFLENATLRPTDEILEVLDLHYRLSWVVHQTSAEGGTETAGLEAGVVQERHFALNWLTRFEDALWDDVTTPS